MVYLFYLLMTVNKVKTKNSKTIYKTKDIVRGLLLAKQPKLIPLCLKKEGKLNSVLT